MAFVKKIMLKNIKYILSISLFFRVFIVFMFSWFYLIYNHGDSGLFEMINASHNDTFDVVFKYATHIGGGWFAFGIAVLLFGIKFRWGIIAAFSFVGSAAITQIMKRWVFNYPRPSVVFQDSINQMNLVEGVELHTNFSFPSGHSTAAFAVFCLLSLIWLEKKYLGFLFCFIAIIIGYSRVYLCQHFPMDVLVGAAIGTICSLIFYALLKDKLFGNWGNQSLFKKSI